jgi:hypothetical protein
MLAAGHGSLLQLARRATVGRGIKELFYVAQAMPKISFGLLWRLWSASSALREWILMS